MSIKHIFISVALICLPFDISMAHGGGVDKNGCHKNSKTGTRHCHNKPQTRSPVSKPNLKRKGDTSYRNCGAVWDAINRPIKRGEPGYGQHLDRDNDGIGCEVRPNY